MNSSLMNRLAVIIIFMLFFFTVPFHANAGEIPFKIPVVVIKYFPVKGDSIDISVTGDWGRSLEYTREKVENITHELVNKLEDGSRFRAYKNSSAPASLDYEILETFEFIEPLPTIPRSGRDPMTDYNAIMERVNAEQWVEEKGVKEFWIWGYHGGVIGLWESNMAGPYGDISNSNRDTTDLPVFSRTYTVYHYNYQRGLSETIENHMHQIEAVLNYVDGRDITPKDQWDQLLFWGKFVGSDITHKIINPGAGWAHYPPNGEKDYDWKNTKFVWTDIEDWKPDGSGEKIKINCERWNCNSVDWFIYWMQSLPGHENGLTYKNQPLRNWWIFIGDWDTAMKEKMSLVK